jgi:hypothetical protein
LIYLTQVILDIDARRTFKAKIVVMSVIEVQCGKFFHRQLKKVLKFFLVTPGAVIIRVTEIHAVLSRETRR